MDKRLFDYDPLTGVTEYFHYDEATDTTTIETVQDVEPFLDVSKGLANDDSYTKDGIKNEMWHYASIPVGIQMKLLVEHGVDVYNKDHARKMFQLLDQEYPALKNTRKHHRPKGLG